MKTKIEKLPVEKFAYMRRTGEYGEENYILMSKLKEWAERKDLLNEETIIYGIARDNPSTTIPEDCRYDVGIVVDENFEKDDKINIDFICSDGKYLVFTIEHTTQGVNEFWSSFSTILNQSNYEWDMEKPILERYAKKMIDKELCEMCVPIK